MIDFICDGMECRITGRLSQDEVVRLWEQRQTLLPDNVNVINLSELIYSDSAGIAFILALISQAKRDNREIVVTSPSTQLSKLIALYDLELFFGEETTQGK